MLDHGFRRDDSAYDALAVEVVYNRALIRPCDAYDIEVALPNLAQPNAGSARLEHELARVGVDLVAPSRKVRTGHS